MAARRGKSQARRNQSNGLPGWAWLVLGILITLAVVLAAPRLLKSDGSGDGFFRPRANPDALPAAVGEGGEPIAPDTAPASAGGAAAPADAKPKPTYDFYTLLPGEEVAMTDAELAASARAEGEAQAKAAQQAAAAATAAAAGESQPGLPALLPEPSAPAAGATPAPSDTVAGAPPAPPEADSTDARYILQAGAFGASGDAEAVKAKIALLGLNARVESAQIGDKTVYRVRMGPYGTASELADAKAKLSSGGLPAMAVKTN